MITDVTRPILQPNMPLPPISIIWSPRGRLGRLTLACDEYVREGNTHETERITYVCLKQIRDYADTVLATMEGRGEGY